MRPLALWSLATRLAAPLLPLWLRRRQRAGREVATRLGERRGIEASPRPAGRLLWLHAASVGETASILSVLSALAGMAPELTVLVTTGTVTSAQLLEQREPRLGTAVLHRFIPLDVPAWVARFLDHWRPDAGGFVESELWPNLLQACRQRGLPLMLVNARMSARSLQRWRRFPGTARDLLGAFRVIQARSAADAGRLAALGAVSVTSPGDLKFAAPLLPADPAEVAALSATGRKFWLAASVHPEEAATIGAAHRLLAARHADLVTLIAPRHPDRASLFTGDEIFTRRSAGQGPPAGAGIWLIDTLGELGLCYRLAPIVLVGGSLFAHGGQNILEPARFGCAIAVGPFTENFADACARLEAVGALFRVNDAAGLAGWVDALLGDPQRCVALGAAAKAAVSDYQDLPARTAATLVSLLPA